MNKKLFLSIVAIFLIASILACSAGPVTVDFNPTAPAVSAPTVAPQATVGASNAYATPAPTVAPATSTSQKVTFPSTVWRKNVAEHDSHYDVTFDESQGGSNDHPAFGWYFQKDLPGSNREAHEVAIILRAPASFKFTGPECTVYWNWDNAHPFDKGKVLVTRQNTIVKIEPTQGAKSNESNIFVRCNASQASGFSFEALEKLP